MAAKSKRTMSAKQLTLIDVEPIPDNIYPLPKYIYAKSFDDIAEYWEGYMSARVLGLDTETTAFNPFTGRIRLIQLAAQRAALELNTEQTDLPVLVIDLFFFKDIDKIKELLALPTIKVLQNAKFDLKFLEYEGYFIGGQIFDTMLASQLLNCGTHVKSGLADLTKRLTEYNLPKDQQGSDWSYPILSERQIEYAARDPHVVLLLRHLLIPELKEANLFPTAKLEFDCVRAVARMELAGMYMSPSRLKDLGNIAHKRKDELYHELHKIFGYINLDSPQQMKDGFLKRGIELESTASWAFTDKRGTPEVDMFLEYKKYAKLVSAFIDKLPTHLNYATHRIHANYNQCWTTTGRFSCSDPNLQQLPADKTVRACFMAEPGNKLVIADYSQIELRVAAEIARDQRMVSAYRNSEDLHTLTASLITGKPREEVTKQDRQKAKAANFGLLYGQGPPGFQKYAKNNYGVEMSLEEATEFREHFFKAYAGLKRWHFETGRKQDFTREVRTLLNRRRLLVPGEAKYTELLNTPIQGTAADITKLALIKLDQMLPKKAKIVGCVHDEILVESPESDAEYVKECVQTAMESAGSEILHHVPVVADAKICDDWSEK